MWKKHDSNHLLQHHQTVISEIITHIAFYAGWPKTWAAFRLAKQQNSSQERTHDINSFWTPINQTIIQKFRRCRGQEESCFEMTKCLSQKVLELLSTSPGLVFPTQGVVRTSPGLVKSTSRSVRLGRQSGGITQKRGNPFWECSYRAREF